MAKFTGTERDFYHFLGPHYRNLVNSLTRKAKAAHNGVCQHCGEKVGSLDAAHVHGRGRKDLLSSLLQTYRHDDEIIIDNLDAFDQAFVALHEPIDKTFLFLCRNCHMQYDAHAKDQPTDIAESIGHAPSHGSLPEKISSQDYASVMSCSPNQGESFQDFVKRALRALYKAGLLSPTEIQRLQERDYSNQTFHIQFPLLIKEDNLSESLRKRYWVSEHIFEDFYACSQWWRDNFSDYETKFAKWIRGLERSYNRGNIQPQPESPTHELPRLERQRKA